MPLRVGPGLGDQAQGSSALVEAQGHLEARKGTSLRWRHTKAPRWSGEKGGLQSHELTCCTARAASDRAVGRGAAKLGSHTVLVCGLAVTFQGSEVETRNILEKLRSIQNPFRLLPEYCRGP